MDRKLQMLTAYLAQLVASEPDCKFLNTPDYEYWLGDEETIFVRFGDEGFEWSEGYVSEEDNWIWSPLETVSQLKELMGN